MADAERDSVKATAADLVERIAARARDVSHSAQPPARISRQDAGCVAGLGGTGSGTGDAEVADRHWPPARGARASFWLLGLRRLLRRVARARSIPAVALTHRPAVARLLVDLGTDRLRTGCLFCWPQIDPHQDTRLVAVALINA